MLKKSVDSAECRVEFDWHLQGSVKRGTVRAGATACRTHFKLTSSESDEDVLQLIKLAKQGCYAEQMVQAPVPLTSTYEVNGREIDVELD